MLEKTLFLKIKISPASLKKGLLWALFLATLLFLLLYKLNNYPPIFFDEGWTLSSARNWILHGHLGDFSVGQPVPPSRLRLPLSLPVALGMRILGIGVWQGRFPIALSACLSLLLLGYIVSKMYNRNAGIAAMLMTLLFSPYPLHPIFLGREAMGEIPMMFYLLAGYSMLWQALTHWRGWGIGAAILFGLAIHAKLQVPPFWLVSISLAIWMAIVFHYGRAIKTLIAIAIGSIIFSVIVLHVQNLIMPGALNEPGLVPILLNTSVIVLSWSVRWKALYTIIVFTLPQTVAYVLVGKQIFKNLFSRRIDNVKEIAPERMNKNIFTTAVWGLGASWLFWYAMMSMYWIRYIFPAYFLGFVFLSGFVNNITNGFDLRYTIKNAAAFLFKREFNRRSIIAAGVILAIGVGTGLSAITIHLGLEPTGIDQMSAATYLANHIPDSALVEMFESELLFLAPELNYHFPPSLVSMQLAHKLNIDPNISIEYDPLLAKPDYLVIGPFARTWGVYDENMVKKWFELAANVGGYQIYRIRSLP